MKTLAKTIACVCITATAMGFLESAVVIYLRELYYAQGFDFPLQPMSRTLALVELLREAATVIMLSGIGYLAGKTRLQRFAYFSLAFAVWDIFYYVFLYAVLGWPQSLLTWDLLFLIPLPWVGPVWAPCLLSILMIAGALVVIARCEKNKGYRIATIYWIALMTGALVCITAFTWDFLLHYLHASHPLPGADLSEAMTGYVPVSFNLALFLSGLALMSAAVGFTIFRSAK